MNGVFVLDAAALLSNWTQRYPDSEFVTTQGILDELRNRPSRERAERLVLIGRMRVADSDPDSVRDVGLAASKLGDLKVLSDNDVSLLAIALSIQGTGRTVTVVSSDLSVLYTATALEFGIVDLTAKMRHQITWILRCPACGHKEQQGSKESECPVCGTKLTRRRKKSKRIV
jgi:rRNA maturation endonuclease Nob1